MLENDTTEMKITRDLYNKSSFEKAGLKQGSSKPNISNILVSVCDLPGACFKVHAFG